MPRMKPLYRAFTKQRRFWLLFTIYWLLIIVLLTACQTAELPSPTPTRTSTPTLTPTPTIVWFPPTNTPTPFPTPEVSPTPEQRTGIGEVLYKDDFSTGEGWPLLTSPRGNVALGRNELTLTLFEPRASVLSVLQGKYFSNFYAEITANVSLCSGEDEFGLLFRVSSQVDLYRFSLSCNGKIRLDRLNGGIASSPQPWLETAIPFAAPRTLRLAIWALGRDMRFFINDEFQFGVSDPTHPLGGIGVFARAAGDTAVTVKFSDLAVYAVERLP